MRKVSPRRISTLPIADHGRHGMREQAHAPMLHPEAPKAHLTSFHRRLRVGLRRWDQLATAECVDTAHVDDVRT